MKTKINWQIVSAFIMILCSVNTQSSGQANKDRPVVDQQQIICKVFYNFVYLKFKSLPDNLYKEELELDLGKTASMFYSHSAVLKDSARQKADALQANQIPIDQQTINLLSANASSDKFYTISDRSNKVIHIQPIATSIYLVSDTAIATQWQILDSTKVIQGYICQKAIGVSHGRNYTAWFCNDLPFSYGPRRLNGLPGLILEAYDDQREIVYTLSHVEKNSQPGKFGLPPDGINATYAEYNKVLDLFEKNPAEFINKLNGPNAKTHAVMAVPPPNSVRTETPKPPVNNPIDLR